MCKTVCISHARLLENYTRAQAIVSPARVAPVIKSNAYGHGLVLVGEILESIEAPFMVVNTYNEACTLRGAGIATPLLIVGYIASETIQRNTLTDVAFTITSLEQLQQLEREISTSQKFHIKIDTGLRRQGVMPSELGETIDIIDRNEHMTLEGVCSHLGDSDNHDTHATRKQISLWNELMRSIDVRHKHLSATKGMRFACDIDANVVRFGIGLFDNVLRMETIVTTVRTLKAGERIGYNFTFTAPHDMRVATVPVGYYEGIDRRLSNKGVMMIGAHVCPIVGRVSMNITSIDVTNVLNARIGTPVVAISDNPEHKNSVENIAKLCDTIPYEILVHIPEHLKRIVT